MGKLRVESWLAQFDPSIHQHLSRRLGELRDRRVFGVSLFQVSHLEYGDYGRPVPPESVGSGGTYFGTVCCIFTYVGGVVRCTTSR